LQLADGVPVSHIATTVGISRRFVYKWVQRFMQDGLDGLADKAGRGHRRLAHPEAGISPQGKVVR
jgi:transposase